MITTGGTSTISSGNINSLIPPTAYITFTSTAAFSSGATLFSGNCSQANVISITCISASVFCSFYLSNDGTNWYQATGFRINAGIPAQSVNTGGAVSVNTSGFQQFKVVCNNNITSGQTTSFVYGVSSVPATITRNSFSIANQDSTTGYTPYAYAATSPTPAGSLTLVATGNKSIGWISVSNQSNNPAYLKLYNAAATSAVTIGTTGATNSFIAPAATTGLIGHYTFSPIGLNYGNGIVFYLSAGSGLTDNTAVSANTPLNVNIGYI